MKINFDSLNLPLPDLDFDKVRAWIVRVAASHGCTVRRLNYLFCDDPAILDANIRYLGHDYFTDIITFDYTRDNVISGDMIISLDTVASNAELIHQQYRRELLRVIIHGVLHLVGINDKGPGEREVMEAAENDALRIWDELPGDDLG